MSDTQKPLQEQITTRAMKDETFRQKLLSDPRQTLERELGIRLPEGVSVHVYEDTATTLHLVLPVKAEQSSVYELSDAELETAAGGVGMVYCYPDKTEGYVL